MTVLERIRDRSATVGVFGMGRVGLPLGIAFAGTGMRVMGLEIDPVRRKAIELGRMPFLEPECETLLGQLVEAGTLTVHDDPAEVVPVSDVIVLCVGTPLTSELRPDYDQLRSALSALAQHVRPGQLLVLRSTVSPGTLQKIVLPFLRKRAPDVTQHLLLAACPERIAEGKAMEELRSLPEIVGGVDDASSQATGALFQLLNPNKQIHTTTPASAELAKLFTNVYRYVNFALANEFALLAEYYGVDGRDIIEMVNHGYPRANVPRPGPTGGPCLSKDGYFLVEEMTMPDFVLIAWKLNDSTPAHIVRRLAGRLSRAGCGLLDTPVAVLGQAFKRDNDDPRQSPAVRMAEILAREGAEVRVHDPYIPSVTLEEALSGAKVFVLATNHSGYETLAPNDVAALMEEPRIGMDCWGMLDRGQFAAAGIDLLTFGVGDEQ